jgi:L-threonylcarbamoyladenylate synthase
VTDASFSWIEGRTLLNDGHLFAYPTDTVWGLGCRADREELVRSCLALKGPHRSPAVSVILSQAQLLEYFPDLAPFFPAPLTFIATPRVDLQENWGHLLFGGKLGFRRPNLPELLQLVDDCQLPLITTSFNKNQEPPPLDDAAAKAQADHWGIPIICGDCGGVVASTILEEEPSGWKILRQGQGTVPKELIPLLISATPT